MYEIFVNFRPDRAREITRCFTESAPEESGQPPVDVSYECMTEYDPTIPALVAFPPIPISNPVGQLVAEAGLRQLRIAETESTPT